MTTRSHQLRRRIAHLRPDWDVAAVSGFIFLEGGYSNDNYRFEYQGERYVLRASRRHSGFADRHLEERLYAEGGGVGMPELVAFDAEAGDMISRWVAGRMLTDCVSDAAGLVDYLRQLHQRIPPLHRIYDPLAQARGHLAAGGAPAWVERLAAEMHWSPDALTSCHNDLNPWNVICTPNGDWVTLDWEWAGRNDPLFDLVTLHQGADLPEPELALMAEHLLGRPASPARLRHCLTAFWLRETAWAAAEVESGSSRSEVVEQRELGLARLRELTDGGPP